MATRTWYSRGEEAYEEDTQYEEQKKKDRASGGSRFRQPTDHESTVTMLDDAAFFYPEHTIKKGDRFVTKTCLGDTGMCPYCIEGYKMSKILVPATVINHTGFTANDGKAVRNFKQFLALKGEAKVEFKVQRKKLKDKNGGDFDLAFTVWEIRRGSNPQSPSTGSHFTYKGRITKEKLIERLKEAGVEKENWDEFLTPIDYPKVFEVETEDQARANIGMKPSSERVGASSGGSAFDIDSDLDEKPIEDFI